MGKKITKVIGHQLFFAKPYIWFALLSKNRVDRRYWHKSFLISLITILIIPLQWIQTILYKKKIGRINLNESPPIFILGHWRSGTTHLHYILHQDSQFGTLSNYQAFLFNVALLNKTWLKWLLGPLMPPTRPQDNTAFDLGKPAEEEQPLSTISTRTGMHSWHFPRKSSYFRKYNLFQGISAKEKKAWQKAYTRCLKNISFYNDKKRLILKNPHNTSRVKELLELFPNAKFIFIYRDPAEVLLSTRHLYKKLVSSQFLQELAPEKTDEIIFYYYKKVLSKYLRERHLVPKGNLIEINYHELTENPITEVKKIYDELNLPNYDQAKPHFESYLNSIKKYKTNDYGKVDDNLKKRLSNELYFEDFENMRIKQNESPLAESEYHMV